MANETIKSLNTRIYLRNDTKTNWDNHSDKVLGKGEVGIELGGSKPRLKIGDGVTTWANLSYFTSSDVLSKTTAPAASDNTYDPGTLWIDTATHKIYMLESVSGSTATWSDITAQTVDTDTQYNLSTGTATNGVGISLGKRNKGGADYTAQDTVNVFGSGSVTVTRNATSGDITITGVDTQANDGTLTLTSSDGLVAETKTFTANDSDNVSFTVKHAENLTQATTTSVSTTAGDLTIGEGSTTIKIPEITFNKYGDATAVGERSVEINIPSTSNNVTASAALTADKIVLGDGNKTAKTSTYGISTTVTETDTELPTSKAVMTYVSTNFAANDAMRYKGTLGKAGATVTALPSDAKTGDLYKVITDNTYYISNGTETPSASDSGDKAGLGDMFIKTSSGWTHIPSGDDGNIYHTSNLASNSVVLGDATDSVKTLTNGTEGQILMMTADGDSLVPAWATYVAPVKGISDLGSGEAISSITLSSSTHDLEITKGFTQTDISKETSTLSTTNDAKILTDYTVSGTHNHTITASYKTFIDGSVAKLTIDSANGTLKYDVTKDSLTALNDDTTNILVLNGGTASSAY